MELIQIVILNPENETIPGRLHACYTTAVLKWTAAHQGYVKQYGKMCVRHCSRWPNIRCIDRLIEQLFIAWNEDIELKI